MAGGACEHGVDASDAVGVTEHEDRPGAGRERRTQCGDELLPEADPIEQNVGESESECGGGVPVNRPYAAMLLNIPQRTSSNAALIATL